MKMKLGQKYSANANRFTFGLVTLLMFGFAALAQSQDLQSDVLSSQSSICINFTPTLCQQISAIQSRAQTQANNPLFLIQ